MTEKSTMNKNIAACYQLVLDDLRFTKIRSPAHECNLMKALIMLADEYINHRDVIVNVIRQQIKKVRKNIYNFKF